MRYALIVNPAAKSGKNKEFLPKIKSYFSRKKYSLHVFPTQKKGDAIFLAKEAAKRKFDVVIAGGGDGTINEVLNGIAGSKSQLGIIPLGTTNVLSLELKIPYEPLEACKFIVSNKPKKLDIGKVNDRYFLSWAGIGLDSRMIQDTENIPQLKLIFGKIAYPLSGLKTLLTYTPSRISVEADGKHYSGYFVLVGNISYYGGKFKVLPKAQANDGKLDICIFKKKNLIHNFRYGMAIGIGQHVNYDDVVYMQVKKIRLDSFKPALIHADAELVSKTPAEIIIKPRFVDVICL
jgi:diacylglycerol kinase (ATP)